MIIAVFDNLLSILALACQACYGSRLVSLGVFGSVGRGTPNATSDIDVLVVAEELPRGRMARVREFETVDAEMERALRTARSEGVDTRLSPILKTPEEVGAGSPLFLDMLFDLKILYDSGGFFAGYLEDLKKRLDRLGAHRVPAGGFWYWDLKPDFKPGDVIKL